MLAVRVALLVTSVVVCGWFGLGAVQTHDQNRATAVLNTPGIRSKATMAKVVGLLDDAGTLNPDRTIDLLRAQAHIVANQRPVAEREALAVLRDEPKNINAWLVLSVAADPRDPATEGRAVTKRRELAPPVPRAP